MHSQAIEQERKRNSLWREQSRPEERIYDQQLYVEYDYDLLLRFELTKIRFLGIVPL
jgi:hypothetical protein